MSTVTLHPKESQEDLLRRFRKKVLRSGLLSAARRKRWFVCSPSTIDIESPLNINVFNLNLHGQDYPNGTYQKEWEFFCKIYKSKSDEGGRVLVIKNLRKKND